MKHALEDRRGLSSLPVAADAATWWREWGPKIVAVHGKQGWILFLLDAQEKLVEVHMLVSRLLRNKPEWDSRGWSQAEWEDVELQTAAAAAWFAQNAPTPMKDAPEWAQFLFSAQHGNFAVLRRLGRELRAIQEQGYLVATVERKPGEGIEWGEKAVEVAMQEAE